jgi:hypothetical protein
MIRRIPNRYRIHLSESCSKTAWKFVVTKATVLPTSPSFEERLDTSPVKAWIGPLKTRMHPQFPSTIEQVALPAHSIVPVKAVA